MGTFKLVLYFGYFALFLVCLVYSLKFQFGSEGRDERGQHINNYAYMAAFPLFPIGWLAATLYHDYVRALEMNEYITVMAILIESAYIMHAFMIVYLKRKL